MALLLLYEAQPVLLATFFIDEQRTILFVCDFHLWISHSPINCLQACQWDKPSTATSSTWSTMLSKASFLDSPICKKKKKKSAYGFSACSLRAGVSRFLWEEIRDDCARAKLFEDWRWEKNVMEKFPPLEELKWPLGRLAMGPHFHNFHSLCCKTSAVTVRK